MNIALKKIKSSKNVKYCTENVTNISGTVDKLSKLKHYLISQLLIMLIDRIFSYAS